MRSGNRGGREYQEVRAEEPTTFFDAGRELEDQEPRQGVFGNGPGKVGYSAGREGLTQGDEEQWDRMG